MARRGEGISWTSVRFFYDSTSFNLFLWFSYPLTFIYLLTMDDKVKAHLLIFDVNVGWVNATQKTPQILLLLQEIRLYQGFPSCRVMQPTGRLRQSSLFSRARRTRGTWSHSRRAQSSRTLWRPKNIVLECLDRRQTCKSDDYWVWTTRSFANFCKPASRSNSSEEDD